MNLFSNLKNISNGVLTFWANILNGDNRLSRFIRRVIHYSCNQIVIGITLLMSMWAVTCWVFRTLVRGLANIRPLVVSAGQAMVDGTSSMSGVSVIDAVEMINSVIPLTDAAAIFILCLEIRMICTLLRAIKSVLPTISG